MREWESPKADGSLFFLPFFMPQGENVKRYFQYFCVSCLIITAMAGSASAAGFALYEWSARGNALGGTLAGRADDPSAVAFNPAGITQLDGTHVVMGTTFALPLSDVVTTDAQGTSTTTPNNEDIFVIPHFYITQRINEKWSVGFGEYSRFGLGFGYKDTWPGAENVYQATIQSISLNPNLAYKVNDRLSLAFGVEYVYVDLEISKRLGHPVVGPKSTLTADGDGFALTSGIHYRLDKWRFGVGYHSQAKINASGKTELPSMSPNTTGTVILPDMINIGLTYYPKENLSIEVGGINTRWSTYRNLDLDVEGLGVVPQPKNAKDVWRYNVGVEYGLTESWDLRASYSFDEAPEDQRYVDYMIPADDRHLISVGTGLTLERWTIDTAYTYIKAEKVNYDLAASHTDGILPGQSKNGVTHMVAVTVGYAF